MRYILYGFAAVGLGVIVMWLYYSIKAIKDPDVKAATDLRMTIGRYNLYKRLYEKHQSAMKEFGSFSSEADEIFAKEIYPKIPNPNEWRRFCDYQLKKQREEFRKEMDDILGY